MAGPNPDSLALFDGIAEVLPPEYAAYQPVLIESLARFIGGLSEQRQQSLIQAQLGMPETATAEQRLVRLMHDCPTLHKLGQVIARHKRLSPALRRELQRLESLEPRTPIGELCALIDRELPERERQGIRLDDAPLAEGSVASIIGFTLCDQAEAPVPNGVFKVLKPGVADALHEELAIWSEVGALLDESTERHGLPALDYRETFDAVRDLLAGEVRFECEQANLVEAQAVYGSVTGVIVPRLFPFCTPTLTAMERIDGVPLSDRTLAEKNRRTTAAGRIVSALLAQPVFSAASQALFHADPHAGNLMLTRDDHLALIDWSLIGRLTKSARESIVQILMGGWMQDRRRVCAAVDRLAGNSPVQSAATDVIDHALARLHGGQIPGITWLTCTLDELAVHGGVRFDSDLMMFRKTLLTLDGLLHDLDPQYPVDAELMRLALAHLVVETPTRFWCDPFSRSFYTHLSNMDLWMANAAMPAMLSASWLSAFSPRPDRS